MPPAQAQPTRGSVSRRTPAQITRRQFMRVAGAGAAGAALAACSPAVGPRSNGTNAIQLVYQDWRTDRFPGLAPQMLEQFHANQPSRQVFYTPNPENVADQMIADAQVGTAPDAFAGCCDFFPL